MGWTRPWSQPLGSHGWEKSHLGKEGKSEDVMVLPRDVFTELGEIVQSKHFFSAENVFFFFFIISEIFCGKCPVSTTILGLSLSKKNLKNVQFLAVES